MDRKMIFMKLLGGGNNGVFKMIIKTVKALLGVSVFGSLFYFSVTQASRPHPKIEQLLSAPSAVQHFRKTQKDKSPSSSQKSSLVVQAEHWAAKPPKPPEPKREIVKEKTKPKPKPEIHPTVSKPKFTVIATSLSRDESYDSLALISELSGEQRWVHVGDKIGHLIIEDILNGKIIYKDGDRSDELVITEPEPSKLVTPSTTPKRPYREKSQTINRLAINKPRLQNLDPTRTYSRPLPKSLLER